MAAARDVPLGQNVINGESIEQQAMQRVWNLLGQCCMRGELHQRAVLHGRGTSRKSAVPHKGAQVQGSFWCQRLQEV
jgi:hypothetical protein